MKMQCDDVRTLLPEFSRLHGAGEDLNGAMEHLLSCPSCQSEAKQMTDLWALLGHWEIAEPGPHVGKAVRAKILADLREAGHAEERVRSWRGLGHFFWPVLLGLGTTSVSVAAISGGVDIWTFSPFEVLTCGILWAGAYIVAFRMALGGRPASGEGWQKLRVLRVSAVMGLMAMGLCLLMGRTFSLATAVEYCRMGPWLRGLFGDLDLAQAYFSIGSIYALLPMLAAQALVGRRRLIESRTRCGAYAGLIYAALLLPAIYLQCGSFTLGVAIGWMGGSLLGALGGGLSGAWLAWRPAFATTS